MGANNGDHLKVNYGSLEEAAAAITTEATNLRLDMEKVQAKIRSVSEIWDGDAKEAYSQAQVAWDQKADDLQNRLLSIAGEVRVASGNYSATDLKASRMF